jgi:hypothetical protein
MGMFAAAVAYPLAADLLPGAVWAVRAADCDGARR